MDWKLWDRIAETHPLIHQLTNVVTVNDCANITLACGASPVMADAPEEAAEMAAASDAVVINIGTLRQDQLDAMARAGESANKHGVPVVLDPVGAGATRLRLEAVDRLLKRVKFSVIRGNSSEIGTLCGRRSGRGVDANLDDLDSLLPSIRNLAKELQTVIAVSGPVDYVTDGKQGSLCGERHSPVDPGHRHRLHAHRGGRMLLGRGNRSLPLRDPLPGGGGNRRGKGESFPVGGGRHRHIPHPLF